MFLIYVELFLIYEQRFLIHVLAFLIYAPPTGRQKIIHIFGLSDESESPILRRSCDMFLMYAPAVRKRIYGTRCWKLLLKRSFSKMVPPVY